MSSKIVQASLVAAWIPFVGAAGFGDEITNNLISDIAPLLALFGERVAQQFISQSVGIADNIIFAVAPLGIITAMVGAISVSGNRLLRSIIGRARERRGDVEIELISSTSTDVCEIWDGSSVVRALGVSPVIELVYVVPNASAGSDSSPLLTRWEDDAGIYDFDSARTLCRSDQLLAHTGCSHAQNAEDLQRGTGSAPNMSLNMANTVPNLERWIVAVFGVVLQLSVIVFALLINFVPHFGTKLQKTGYRATIYAPLMATGTVILVVGMFLCSHIVERSTVEESWEVKRRGGVKIRVAWLQKGGVVGDQLFNAYALFPSLSQANFQQPCLKFYILRVMRAILNRFITLADKHRWFVTSSTIRSNVVIVTIVTSIGNWLRPFATWIDDISIGRMCLRTSRPKSTADHEILTMVAVLLSLGGFVGQFLGLRGLHWSVTVMQLGATVVMTILRAWVRRMLVHEPIEYRLDDGYELDWMAKNIMDCTEWRVVTWGFDRPLPSQDIRAANVFAARRRLGALSRWPSQWQTIVNSTAEAIAASMNFLFASPDIIVKDTIDWATRDRFEWCMTVEVEDIAEGGPLLGEISLCLVRSKLVDGPWGPWRVTESEVGAVLGLWMLHFHNLQLQAQKKNIIHPGNRNLATEETASNHSQPILRILGLYDELTRMDYERWIARQTQPLKVQSLDEFLGGENERCKYVIGNPTNNNLGHGNSVLGVITSSPPERLCGQSIYSGFMSAMSEHVKIGGKVQIRWAGSGVRDAFGLHCAGLVELAGIVERAGLANSEEAYMCIVPPFSQLETLPVAAGDKAVLVEIVEAANHHTRENRLDQAEWFLLWLFCSAEIMASVYNARKHWRKAVEIYSDLRSVCAKIEHPLAADYTDEADNRISLFCETVLTIITLDSVNGSNTLNSIPAWMAELLGENGKMKLENWKQLNPEQQFQQVPMASKDEQLCKAVVDGRIILVGRLLANGANINCCQCEHSLQTPLMLACIAGHGAVTQYLIVQGADLAAQDYYGRTALHYTVAKGHISIARILVPGGGPLVNILDQKGQTPLDLALAMNVGAVVNLLLFHGANDNTGQARKLLSEMNSPAEDQLLSAVDDGSGRLPVHWAAWVGSNRVFRAILDKNSPTQPKDILELTPLHIAATNGSLSIVEMLLKHSAIEVDVKDRRGQTALHHAASSGHDAIVRLLLQYGANVNAKDVNEEMPLHKTVIFGEEQTLRLLLDLGADQETRYGDGGTLLHKAASEGHFTTARLLLSRQADVQARNLKHDTALHRAAHAGHEAIVSLLLDHGADIEGENENGEHPLHQAASQGLVKVVELLLVKGANQAATDGHGETIFHKATSAGQVTTLRFLLDRQADCQTRYSDGESLLQRATREGHHGIVELLLERGQDCETRFSDGRTLLFEAASNGHDQTVKVLLDHGAKDYRADGQSRMSLHKPVIEGHIRTVQVLLDHSVNVGASNTIDGGTLLQAALNGHTRIVEQLLDQGVSIQSCNFDLSTPLHFAATNGHTSTIKLLLDFGADISARDMSNRWALHIAAGRGHTATVELLLDYGADIEVLNDRTPRPLIDAVSGGHAAIVKLLLDRGASVERVHALDSWPIHIAANVGHTSTMELLLDRGADINSGHGRTMTALQIARREGNQVLVQLLRDRGAIE